MSNEWGDPPHVAEAMRRQDQESRRPSEDVRVYTWDKGTPFASKEYVTRDDPKWNNSDSI